VPRTFCQNVQQAKHENLVIFIYKKWRAMSSGPGFVLSGLSGQQKGQKDNWVSCHYTSSNISEVLAYEARACLGQQTWPQL